MQWMFAMAMCSGVPAHMALVHALSMASVCVGNSVVLPMHVEIEVLLLQYHCTLHCCTECRLRENPINRSVLH